MSAGRVRAVFLAALVIVSVRGVSSQAPVNPVVYSEAQATRGEDVFKRVCVECHARTEMSNNEFRGKWNGRSAFDFVDRIRSTMPESDPGGLPRGQYLDVAAFVARINGIPAGTVDLPDDDAALRKQILVLPATDRILRF